MNLNTKIRYFFNFKNLLNIYRILFEKFNGLDFTSIILSEEVGLDSNLSYRSSPSGEVELRSILLKVNINSRDKILDIGCGKGKAMATMLKFPFLRVDGIEISEKISLIATKNMIKLNQSHRAKIECINALEYSDYSNYNIFYFYNPFPISIMKEVITKILKTVNFIDEVIIIYNNPTCEDVILNQGVFNQLLCIKNEWGDLMKVYSNRDALSSRVSKK